MIEQTTPTKQQEHKNNNHEHNNKYTPPQQPNSIIISVMVIVKKEDNGNKLHWHMQLCICHHHMLLTSSIITELDISKKSRRKCIFGQRLSACDHNCHFLFIGVAVPGIMGNQQAIHECGLSKLVESTRGVLYCIGDCAYTPMENLLLIYRSEQEAKERYDNFNFYTSQFVYSY